MKRNFNETMVRTRIKSIMKAQGISRQMLAEKIGVNEKYICSIIGGSRELSVTVLYQIAIALRTTFDFLERGSPSVFLYANSFDENEKRQPIAPIRYSELITLFPASSCDISRTDGIRGSDMLCVLPIEEFVGKIDGRLAIVRQNGSIPIVGVINDAGKEPKLVFSDGTEMNININEVIGIVNQSIRSFKYGKL